MQIAHSAVVSPIYEISKLFEFDLRLGDESWPIRIEVLRNTQATDRFRCRIWQGEFFQNSIDFSER